MSRWKSPKGKLAQKHILIRSDATLHWEKSVISDQQLV